MVNDEAILVLVLVVVLVLGFAIKGAQELGRDELPLIRGSPR
jgi:hypothetical protein